MRRAAGRVSALLLAGLLLMSVVGLAASQTFINKTGKTVTGITITFSRRVTITRHDSAFPEQSPSGRAQEFTFSGRDLRNLGRFSITWLPSSAKVTDYEWIEKAQPAQARQATSPSSEQEFTLPDPNTPPILYGNDYPGPDEPLYQPQPDEQIWLTDADRHGDIYDNDSIKINYAPGFDKSQITKIDVYRNGIELRFLPQKIDVLTNAQMKTFDGNPAEHSPASNHTDHAIMGYEYKFEIHTADHLWILTKTVKSGFRWRPQEVWASLGVGWYWKMIDSMPLDKVVQFLEYLKEDGFTGISLNVIYYMNTPYDDDVFELYDSSSNIMTWDITTATISELEKMLMAGKESGMEINVRGTINISKKYQDEHGFTWCNQIDPKNPKEFFDDYTNLWFKLVPLLNKYNVKLMSPFIETTLLEKYSDLIKTMYTKISSTYNGAMGFEESISNRMNGNNPLNYWPIHTLNEYKQLVKNFTFWDWVGSKGKHMRSEFSVGNPKVETQKDQRVSVMFHNFITYMKPAVEYFNSTYPEVPQMFGELAATNADGQSMGSDYYTIPTSQKVMDEQERADFMLATLMASKAFGSIMAINLWGGFTPGDVWTIDVDVPTISTGHYDKPVSPMYRVFAALIKRD